MAETTHEWKLQFLSILADLYRTNDRALDLADRAGLSIADIPQSPVPRSTLWNIIREAENQQLVDRVVAIARGDYPRHPGLLFLSRGAVADVSGPEIGQDLAWKNQEVVVGANDLLPISFLEVGQAIAGSVVRISLRDTFGTGFAIGPDLILTNHHVLASVEDARAAVIELDFEETIDGLPKPSRKLPTRADDRFVTNVEDDWTVVRTAALGVRPIPLVSAATPKVNDRVFIIQHPGGGPKQVALGDNTLAYLDARRLQYLTDTRPGSSGSPIFDDRWRLVGLHHSGGWVSEPGSKELRFRNEGIALAAIRAGLATAGVEVAP